ncbi:hypothetical protein [Prevotella sp.]|uniref:hypothetical protein n=1 Tax=Prevotella sp. TaxID=59823 RepID=UPI0025E3C2A1|nr:hypothetical protein [Prevotella sp.]
MGFWKELGVTALEKGKNLFRGGKQAVEGAKHVEGIVKDAKVSIPATTKPTSYRAWEKSLSPPSFSPAFNQSKTGWKTQMKDFWGGLWKHSPKEAKPAVANSTSGPSFTERVKNWFSRHFSRQTTSPSVNPAIPGKPVVPVSPVIPTRPVRPPVFKDSGYLAWEKSLPTPSFKPRFNVISKEKESVKTSKETVEQVIKKEKKTVETVKGETKTGKETPKETAHSTEQAAEKVNERAKESVEQAGKATKEAAKGENSFKKAAKFYAKNPKALGWHAALGLGGYSLVSGDGVINPLLYFIGGKNATENGLGGMVGQAVAGEKAPGIYDTVTNAADSVVNEGVDLYQFSKNTLGNVVGEGTDLYQMGKNYVGNGMVSNGSGGYYDPTTEQTPNLYQASNPDMGNQDGMLNNVMGGMNHLVNQVSGGAVTKMNILSLALSAYMMFGRFGWLGRAASLLLGGMTLKNINNRQLPYQQVQQQ